MKKCIHEAVFEKFRVQKGTTVHNGKIKMEAYKNKYSKKHRKQRKKSGTELTEKFHGKY